MKMKPLLIICMLTAGILPLAIAFGIIERQASQSIEQATFQGLETDVQQRKTQLTDYLGNTRQLNLAMSKFPTVKHAMRDFSDSFRLLDQRGSRSIANSNEDLSEVRADVATFYRTEFIPRLKDASDSSSAIGSPEKYMPTNTAGLMAQYHYISANQNPVGSKHDLHTHDASTPYGKFHDSYHDEFTAVLEEFGFYDIFLIDAKTGDIVYSVYKEVDFGTSLFNGPYRDSNLAEVTREALNVSEGTTTMVDFKNYTPSFSAPAAFVAAPVYENGNAIGVLAFQLPVSKINKIMTSETAFPESGEALIVGLDNLMRSQSRFEEENSILRTTFSSEATKLAKSGEHGIITEVVDGEEYLTAYTPLDIDGVVWSAITRVSTTEALAPVSALLKTAIIVVGMSCLFVTIFAIYLGRHLFNLLGGDPQDMSQIAEAVASGDLSNKPGDEQAKGAYAQLVKMRTKLRGILQETAEIAQNVRVGAQELTKGSQGLSERTELQASNLEQTGASTEELTSTVKQNAENAKSANELAIKTRDIAVNSGGVSSKAVVAMQDINASSERIADIIGVINEIAFQTNLLALNAAVEAARAGEQGRGFAVVASEVRQLAGRSASAAKEIKELIEDSVSKVRDGTGLVTKAGDELKEIVASVTELTDIVGQISVATNEQAIGLDQINQSLVHMDSMTQQNASLVQEATKTSSSMSAQANVMSTRIAYFSGGTTGGNTEMTSQPEPGELPPAKVIPQGSWQSSKANTPPAQIAANQPSSNNTVKRASGQDEFWDEF